MAISCLFVPPCRVCCLPCFGGAFLSVCPARSRHMPRASGKWMWTPCLSRVAGACAAPDVRGERLPFFPASRRPPAPSSSVLPTFFPVSRRQAVMPKRPELLGASFSASRDGPGRDRGASGRLAAALGPAPPRQAGDGLPRTCGGEPPVPGRRSGDGRGGGPLSRERPSLHTRGSFRPLPGDHRTGTSPARACHGPAACVPRQSLRPGLLPTGQRTGPGPGRRPRHWPRPSAGCSRPAGR